MSKPFTICAVRTDLHNCQLHCRETWGKNYLPVTCLAAHVPSVSLTNIMWLLFPLLRSLSSSPSSSDVNKTWFKKKTETFFLWITVNVSVLQKIKREVTLYSASQQTMNGFWWQFMERWKVAKRPIVRILAAIRFRICICWLSESGSETFG